MNIYMPLVVTPIDYSPPDHQWEVDMINLLITDSQQQRTNLRRSEILMQVAQMRVDDMANRNYFGHVDPDGFGPNYHVRQSGFPLPDYYGDELHSNNVESIGAGFPTARDCWNILTNNSPSHRIHLLGEHPFYLEQDCYGVGYIWNPNTTWHHFYCFLIAKEYMVSGE